MEVYAPVTGGHASLVSLSVHVCKMKGSKACGRFYWLRRCCDADRLCPRRLLRMLLPRTHYPGVSTHPLSSCLHRR